MNEQYDAIGGKYAGWKAMPVVVYTEVPTVRRLLDGRIEGREVLDLACGTGFYSRLLKQWGAARVVGVDVSAAMIAEARQIEAREPVGIEYLQADAAALPVLDTFDVVTAMYLLHYAGTPDVMHRMCRNIAANLKTGGQFFGLLPEPDYVIGKGETECYGYSYHLLKQDRDWMLVRADVHTTPPFSIEYRHWARKVFEDALQTAGFADLRWHPFEVSSEGLARFGADYWRGFLENPTSAVLTARKAG